MFVLRSFQLLAACAALVGSLLLQGKSANALRINPRDGWYHNLKEVVTNGDYEVIFQLIRP
jgi:hypothetical protein